MSDPLGTDIPWQRLSARVVWVDIAVSVLALLPGAVAIWGFGVEASLGALWPLALVAAAGLVGAVGDILRWSFTTYRVTASDIERRTGLFVRRHRTVHRDRVRSVDTTAKLRHRLGGLRVVTIGAGQQTGAGEAALVLDALSVSDAAALRERLLASADHAAAAGAPDPEGAEDPRGESPADASERAVDAESVDVLATFRPWWVVYNMFSIWGYLMAAGLLWVGYWLASTFGIDLFGIVSGLADWEAVGWVGATLLALVGAGILGAIGMGANFLLGYFRFELARVRSGDRSYLRTRRGLLSTREVNRDESRMRGLSIGEPVLWRWMGMADMNVITTGLNVWDMSEPTAILPRGPITVARAIADDVFGPRNPFQATLARHPRAALRRRLWWATAVSAAAPAALIIPAVEGIIPSWTPWAAAALWPIALAGAVIAYRSLGHAVVGDYLVVRAGLLTRTTSALRRDAVSTIAVRQSILQRRLGLATVSSMTAAGWSAYEAPDVPATDALVLASAAAPGVIDDFLEPPTTDHPG